MKTVFAKKTGVITIALLFFFTQLTAQQTPAKGFDIVGHFGGIVENDMIYVGLVVDGLVPVKEDSTYAKDGYFHLKGHVIDGPRQYQVRLPLTGKIIRLFLDNGDSVVMRSPDIGQIHHGYIDHNIIIEGSPSNYAMNCLSSVLLKYAETMHTLKNYLYKLKDSVGFDPCSAAAILEAKEMLTQFFFRGQVFNSDVQNQPAYPAIAYWLYDDASRSPAVQKFYDNLDEKQKKSFYGKKLQEKLALGVGKTFPLFTLPTVDDKLLALKDIISKSKITLVNFWSVKSVTVGKEYMDEVSAMYRLFHDKGLSVVGVSSDTLDYEWKGYVKRQKFPWQDVSDLKGESGIVGTVYHEFGETGTDTPNITHVLVDHEGKIIAWDPSGLELQYYLWKYLINDVAKK